MWNTSKSNTTKTEKLNRTKPTFDFCKMITNILTSDRLSFDIFRTKGNFVMETLVPAHIKDN
jgi:hypothetical protein